MRGAPIPEKESEEESIANKSLVRSPGYPMIGLEEAIEKVKILWDKDKTNSIPREVAAKHLGYGTGGYGGRVIAALKHFGLISMKEGDIILSDKAVELAHYSPSDEIYHGIVKEIALYPNTYKDLFNEYNGSLPSEATLKVKLIKDYKFNAKKVDSFINNFRSTLEFAGLLEGGRIEAQRDESMIKEIAKARTDDYLKSKTTLLKSDYPFRPQSSLEVQPIPGIQHFPIPLSKRKTAILAFETLPVEKKDIEAIKKWLDLFAESLTESQGE